MRVECDAVTRKIGERHVARADESIRHYLRTVANLAAAEKVIGMALHVLVTSTSASPFDPCGWSGDVADPTRWTCPACLTEHATPEPDGEPDVSPADAAYYADRAVDRYEQRLYGGA